MTRLWNLIDNRKLSDEGKIRVFFFLNCLVYCVIGLLVWLVLSRLVISINTLEWALCFSIYPAFFVGYIGGFIYLSRKEQRP